MPRGGLGGLIDRGRQFLQRTVLAAAVPFETPALRFARVREDERHRLVALLHDFADNGSVLVVPWDALPTVVAMSARDAALHTAIAEAKAVTPDAIRSVMASLATSGALGAEAQARQATRTRVESQRQSDMQAILLFHLLRTGGADLTPLLTDPQASSAAAKREVRRAAASLRIGRREIYSRAVDLARIVLPVGSPPNIGPARPGWLRLLSNDVSVFGAEAEARGANAMPEAAHHLHALASEVSSAMDLSRTVLHAIDGALEDIRPTIRSGEAEFPLIRRAIDRLSWTLDGWPEIVSTGREILAGPAGEAVDRLLLLRRLLPAIPERDEFVVPGLSAPKLRKLLS
ncbi:MAG: hypothetical protein ACREFU_08030 [Acetobacteraceae bacterium]